MSKEAEIVSLLRRLCNRNADFSFVAEVSEHYPAEEYVDVKALDGTQYHKVRKKAGIDGNKGILITPVKGSHVIVSRLEDSDDLYIACFGEIHSVGIDLFENKVVLDENQILLQSGDFSVKVDGEGVTLNDGTFGGLIKIETLKTELDKNSQILQAMLTVLGGIAVTEPGNGLPSALQTALKTALTGKQVGTFTEIENNKVNH